MSILIASSVYAMDISQVSNESNAGYMADIENDTRDSGEDSNILLFLNQSLLDIGKQFAEHEERFAAYEQQLAAQKQSSEKLHEEVLKFATAIEQIENTTKNIQEKLQELKKELMK
jgi:uncharacterized coiled-coil DUF342 family protein